MANVLCQDNINGILITVYDDSTADIKGPNFVMEKVHLPFEMNTQQRLLKISAEGEINFHSVDSSQSTQSVNVFSFQKNNSRFTAEPPPESRDKFSKSNEKKDVANDEIFKISGSNNVLTLTNTIEQLNISGTNNDVTISGDRIVIKTSGSNNTIFVRGTAKLIDSTGSNNTVRFLNLHQPTD